METFDAGADVDSTPIIQAYTLLQFRLTKAAESFSSTTPRIIEITTETTIPLRAIVAEFYGAEVHYFKWNDSYADARNESIKYATGDYFMYLDADELLVPIS